MGGTSLSAAKGVAAAETTPFASLRDVPLEVVNFLTQLLSTLRAATGKWGQSPFSQNYEVPWWLRQSPM